MTDWRKNAECARRGLESELFFPEKEGGIDFRVIEACRECPVIRECLEYALDIEHRSPLSQRYRTGIYGGMTPRQRTNLVNRQRTTTIFSHDSMSYRRAMRRRYVARILRDSSQPSDVLMR